MASNPPVGDYEACVLYPSHLRNILLQGAFDGIVEARWTDDIALGRFGMITETAYHLF